MPERARVFMTEDGQTVYVVFPDQHVHVVSQISAKGKVLGVSSGPNRFYRNLEEILRDHPKSEMVSHG